MFLRASVRGEAGVEMEERPGEKILPLGPRDCIFGYRMYTSKVTIRLFLTKNSQRKKEMLQNPHSRLMCYQRNYRNSE